MTPTAVVCPGCAQRIQVSIGPGKQGMPCPACGKMVAIFQCETVCAPSAVPALRPPSTFQLPGYEVLRQIGQGGMGVVYEARQLSLDRKVAIKLLPPELLTRPDFLIRFDREAAVLARLSHPNIVAIYERGRVDGQPYFIMEFVEGSEGGPPRDFRHLLQTVPLDGATIRRLMLQVVEALAYAHAEGVIHRDVKPSNILISRHGNAKLTDFGIAAMHEPGNEQLTHDVTSMGTLHYMAPEQHRDAARVDARADIYSAGVVLYELLTGQLPLGAYDPPSQAMPGREPGWDAVVTRTLRPQPDQRWASMNEFAEAIESVPLRTIAPACGTTELVETTFVSGDSVVPKLAPTEAGVCGACTSTARRDEEFCRSCGAELWNACPACETRTWAADRFCPGCGTDISKQQHFSKFIELAEREAKAAATEGSLASRLEHAEQAVLAWVRALKIVPGNDHAQSGLQGANQLVIRLAGKDAEAAFAEKQWGRALSRYERLVELGKASGQELDRLRKIRELRDNLLQQARRHLAQEKAPESIATLRTAQAAFPEDEEIRNLLHDVQARAVLVKHSLQDRLPGLNREKQFYAMRDLVQELKRSGFEIAGLARYERRIERQILRVESLVKEAERLLDSAKYVEALQIARLALQEATDCRPAADVATLAEQKETALQAALQRSTQARFDQRWFRALEELKPLSSQEIFAYGLGPAIDALQARIYRTHARLKQLLWTVSGLAMVLASGALAFLIFEGVAPSLPTSSSGLGLVSLASLRVLVELLPQPLFALVLLHLLALGLRLRPTPRTALGCALLVLFAGSAASIVIAWTTSALGQAEQLSSGNTHGAMNAFAGSIRLIPWCMYWCACTVALAILTRHALGERGTPPVWPTLWAGVLMALLALRGPSNLDQWMAYLPATMMVCGALAFVPGAKRPLRFLILTAAWLLAAALNAGMARANADWYVHAGWIIPGLCVGIAAALVVRPFHWQRCVTAIALVFATILLETVIATLPSLPAMTALAAGWVLMCSGIAAVGDAANDPWHFRDWWRYRKGCPMLSSAEASSPLPSPPPCRFEVSPQVPAPPPRRF